MIRKMEKSDTEKAMEIWLDTNIHAHSFIPEKYWEGNFQAVAEMLPQAEVFLYEEEASKEMLGFIGLDGGYIAGLFVRGAAQSRGIGKQLLDFVKERKGRLTLSVYQKNTRAIRFYQREGFLIQRTGTDENTGETEYAMMWKQEDSYDKYTG